MNTRLTTAMILTLCLSAGCQGKENTELPDDVSDCVGVVINEIAAHDETTDATSWVELLNTSTQSIDISKTGLYLTDQYFDGKCIYTAPEGTVLQPGERLVLSTDDEALLTGIASDSDFSLKLARSEEGKAIDEFSPVSVFGAAVPQTAVGSYQRIPDGATSWRNLTYSSQGRENAVFDVNTTKGFGIWVWSSHVASLMANDGEALGQLRANGIDHVILNYAAFSAASKKSTLRFIAKAESLGLTVHAWIQCFHTSSGWVNPIDDDNACYKDDVFESIVLNAKTYIEEYGVKGIHLDYIRFPGTAPKHNVSAEVNSIGAVTRCCREMRELCDSYAEGIVISAAMMPDETSDGYYYGQNRTKMGQYLDIFMPMIYRYSYNYSDYACQKKANAFADYGAKCWPGTTTYSGNDSKVTPLNAQEVLSDCEVYKGTKAEGIVLFRNGLGEVPDLSEFTFDE